MTFTEASRLHVAAPRASDEAQYSLPFPLAACLVRGRLGPEEIDGAALADERILRLSRATELIDDPRYAALFPAERWAEVEISLHDGTVLRSRPAVARGSAENPLADEEVREKFHTLMRAGGVGGRADEIAAMVAGLEEQRSLAPLLRLACAAPETGEAP